MTGCFGSVIIIFTFFSKVLLFPVSLMSQKNSIIMVKMMPMLDDMKARYESEPSQLIKEQRALYKKEKYSTLKAVLPLLLQIPIIIGIVQAVNIAVADTTHFDFGFFGLDLKTVPTFFSASVLIPVLAVLSSVLLCWIQNVFNVASREQSFLAQWGTTIFLAVFSGYFAFACPSGVGLYWTISNLMGVVVQFLCNAVYNPKKYIDYENRTQKVTVGREEKEALRLKKKQSKAKEREDSKRFYSVHDKKICFYSEASGFYKYFRPIVEYLLEHSDIDIHYVTNDFEDRVFNINNPRFHAYYCSPYGFITMAMKMDAELVVMTTPDLETYQIKRSLVKKDIEYIYLDHGMTSLHLCLREGALDHFDTVFCYGPTHNAELLKMEQLYKLPKRRKVNMGFPLIAELIETYEKLEKKDNPVPQILIAPSWQKDNICELCLYELIGALSGNGYHIILRPHPEFVKRFRAKMNLIEEKLSAYEDVEVQTDFSSNETVYRSDLLITDWSSIGLEFSLTTKKPSLYINTPMKIMNPNYEKLGIEPLEIRCRELVGVSLDVPDIPKANTVVSELLSEPEKFRGRILDFMREELYPLDNCAESAGDYLLGRVHEIAEKAAAER